MDFSDWLQEQMDNRGWKPADLAKAAAIGSGSLSRILNRQRKPGPEICTDIARALHLPPEMVFRKAGLLPDNTPLDIDPSEQELTYLYRQLAPEHREVVLDILKGYVREKNESYRLSKSRAGT